MEQAASTAEPWSAFWQTADTHGCTAGFPPWARDAIAARWRTLFDGMDKGSRVLDLGSGKGALLDHAAASGLDRLQGCDLAQVDSDWPIAGGIDLRALPYDDRAYDVVVSQFGLEYAGLDTAVDEAARVCRRDLVLLLHARESEVCQQAREQAAQIDWLLGDQDLFGRLQAHFSAPSVVTAADMNAVLNQIGGAASTAANRSLLDGVAAAATALQDRPDPLAEAAALASEMTDHGRRMRAMVEAALDAAATDALRLRLIDHGLRVRVVEEDRNGALVGRWMVATSGDEAWFDRL